MRLRSTSSRANSRVVNGKLASTFGRRPKRYSVSWSPDPTPSSEPEVIGQAAVVSSEPVFMTISFVCLLGVGKTMLHLLPERPIEPRGAFQRRNEILEFFAARARRGDPIVQVYEQMF